MAALALTLVGLWVVVALALVHVGARHARDSAQLATAVLFGVLWPLVCIAILFSIFNDEETWS